MSDKKMPSSQEVIEEMKKTTLYPSGKENIGAEPIKGGTILEQDKSSKLEKGLRIAGGIAAVAAACSLMQDTSDFLENGPTLLNTMIGTSGEFLTLIGGSLIASGKAGQEIVKELLNVGSEKLKKDSDKIKKDFVTGVANSRKEGVKIGKRFQSYTKEAISGLKGKVDSTQEFEIYRPKRDGSEGVELDAKIVTHTNQIKNTKDEFHYERDDNGNMKIVSAIFGKARGGKE